ncbi:MAG TPA: hypothetical protein VF218_10540 [Acidothermaceae bacterium]|jgi:hypothetical protein
MSRPRDVTVGSPRPAFYAFGNGDGGPGDWVSLLHLPYTAWHLSYVAIGAALAAPMRYDRLGWTLLAFFLGLGVGAHALDEVRGHPLNTGIPDRRLLAVAVAAIGAAAAIGWLVGGLRVAPFIVVGASLAFAYNLEWFGGFAHNAIGFGLAWGAFPTLTGYYAQHWTVSVSAVVASAAAFALTLGQRALSTPARWLRRRVVAVTSIATLADGGEQQLTSSDLVRPLEHALRAITCGVVLVAVALVIAAH